MQQDNNNEIHENLKNTAIFLAEYAATMMAIGAQTSRVQLNTVRMAHAFGYKTNLLIFPQTISITLLDVGHNHTYTYIKKTPTLGINFKANMKLSELSWKTFDEKLKLPELWQRFKSILKEKHENRWVYLSLYRLPMPASAGFSTGTLPLWPSYGLPRSSGSSSASS